MPRNTTVKNRIVRIGVELEGGWDTPLNLEQARFVRDTSIIFPLKNHPTVIGEIPSPPLTIGQLPYFIKKYYPPHVNETCGLHVHMSVLRKFWYEQLMDPAYQETMFKQLAEWAEAEKLAKDHPIWKRLSGTYKHCKKEFLAPQQVKVGRKIYGVDDDVPYSRYTGISYRWRTHKTVECRILPMMEKPDQALRSIKKVLLITNTFLSRQGKREKKQTVALRRSLPSTTFYHKGRV